MRKVAVIALVVMASFVLAASVMAQSGIREECVTLCKDAAKFINEKGLGAGKYSKEHERPADRRRRLGYGQAWPKPEHYASG